MPSSHSPESATPEDARHRAHQELQRAYLLITYGHCTEALEACERAAELLPDHPLPLTLKGGILIASGQLPLAIRTLQQVKRTHRDDILASIYMAEACFLAGRHRRAWRVLDEIDPEALAQSPHAELALALRETWSQIPPDELPKPLQVNLDDESQPIA
ncbi:hypothetical protein DV096_06135 [Bradymonadaceae bacterium TMQ3]|uniref:Tetratricopeptide repeat protein n=1 Tax=Lujinxingia sediminis TaxID=2480984 RepID=A0ABY0CQC0_9DELT|nr:tetratricopeptide repeat protein [Lujinxingia sediminis]RDV38395.1 hypothetical protein DV096_06135 [Bradymonadaceae bacterium TMQ3]RVU42555.1 hypothetical protein EA187_15300 [Lujinxingia sediminis]TXC76834.1 hypothetical protein FRC91_08920 [Bradymonadales bacterium TMQ1]